jgi:hypothetical protein
MLVIAALAASGCKTTPITATASTTPLHDKTIEVNHGKVRGSHRAWSVFGLWMVGRPDTDKAIQKALEIHGADALINVTCYERMAWYFFVSSHDVVVEGEAVVFRKGGGVGEETTAEKKDGGKVRDGKRPKKR